MAAANASKALSLQWAFGVNNKIVAGVHDLSGEL
jgi:hypothetical protein